MYVGYRGTSTVIQTMSVAINQVPVFEMKSDWQNSVFFILCDSAVSRLGDEWDFDRVAGFTYFDEVCSRVVQSHMAYCQLFYSLRSLYTLQMSVIRSIFTLYTA